MNSHNLLDYLLVDHSGNDERRINLVAYEKIEDAINDVDKYDYILIIQTKDEKNNHHAISGVNLKSLKPSLDMRPFYPCWISEPFIINNKSKRGIIYEPDNLLSLNNISDISLAFQAVHAFVGGDKGLSIQIPLINIYDVKDLNLWTTLLRLAYFYSASLSARAKWSSINICITESESLLAKYTFEQCNMRYNAPLPDGPVSDNGGITPSEYNITERQYQVIRSYTHQLYSYLNIILNSDLDDPEYGIASERYIKYEAAIECLSTGLYSLDNDASRFVTRFTGNHGEVDDVYRKPSKFIELKGYNSATRLRSLDSALDNPTRDLEVRFYQPTLGKYISPFSLYPEEEEVLLDKGTCIIITGIRPVLEKTEEPKHRKVVFAFGAFKHFYGMKSRTIF